MAPLSIHAANDTPLRRRSNSSGIMPPPGAGARTDVAPDGRKIRVATLSADDELTVEIKDRQGNLSRIERTVSEK